MSHNDNVEGGGKVTGIEITPVFTEMPKVLPVFELLTRMVKINGRRKFRAEREVLMRLRTPESESGARTAKMAPRHARRLRVKQLRVAAKKRQPEMNRKLLRDAFPFRPVLGYVGPLPATKDAASHEDVIAYMKTRNHDFAAEYAERQAAQIIKEES